MSSLRFLIAFSFVCFEVSIQMILMTFIFIFQIDSLGFKFLTIFNGSKWTLQTFKKIFLSRWGVELSGSHCGHENLSLNWGWDCSLLHWWGNQIHQLCRFLEGRFVWKFGGWNLVNFVVFVAVIRSMLLNLIWHLDFICRVFLNFNRNLTLQSRRFFLRESLSNLFLLYLRFILVLTRLLLVTL